ncbi:MAG TPA: dihydropyrimidinase [Anaeromyxobacter sp.]|nr:dihydropyrimidinase [Anaeromyxobacter sp.]
MAARILFRGGTVVSSERAVLADLLVEGEQVAALGAPGRFEGEPVDERIDAAGKLVLPGLVDPHLHFDSPFMGTVTVHGYGQGTVAAAHGGITTVIDFTTQPKGGSILQNVAEKEALASQMSCIDFGASGILLDASPATLAELPRLVEAGIPTYKCFTTYKHSGRLVEDEGILALLEATARTGGMLMVHAENDAIVESATRREVERGHLEPAAHARARPAAAEIVAVRRILDLVRQVPAPVFLVHLSTAGAVALVREAREEGLPVHAETCTHYLALTEEALRGPKGQLYICSPPLRGRSDVEALWRALASGSLELVSSDDAGVPPADNIRIGAGRFDKVPSGLSGIECRLPILFTEGVVKGRIDLPRLVALTASEPARLFGLAPQKGALSPGADADVVIYDPKPEWVMTAARLHMATDFCPFEGFAIRGRVESVWCRGAPVIRDGAFVGRPGHGRRVFRRL